MFLRVDQSARPNAVVAGLMVLDSVVTDRVTQRVEEVILQVVMRAKKRVGFHDELAVRRRVLRRHFQVGCTIADHIDHVQWNFSCRHKLNLAIDLAGNQRRVHQHGERHRAKRDFPSLGGRGGQRRSELPARGQTHGRRQFNRVGRNFVGIEHDLVPVEIKEVAGRGQPSPTCTVHREQIELCLDLLHSGRHRHVEGIHFDRIAMPRKFLITSAKVQTSNVCDRPAGAVIARNPLGIDVHHISRRGRQRDRRVKNISTSVSEVDRHAD